MMKYIIGLLCIIHTVIGENVAGEKSSFNLMVPEELKSDGTSGIMHAEALFGVNPYGGKKKLIGEIEYMTNTKDQNGCTEYSKKPSQKGLIFLVDRGDCTFVQKVRIAQSRGAIAVVIADNLCQCSNARHVVEQIGHTKAMMDQCVVKAEEAKSRGQLQIDDICESRLPFMADDGSGGDITIPSFIIDFYEAQRIKDCIYTSRSNEYPSEKTYTGINCKSGSKIIASLQWDLPNPDNNVEYDLWTSSDSDASFKKEFRNISFVMKDTTTFTPHYFVWNGEDWGCTMLNGLACGNQCTQGGRYCNPDPDKNLAAGVSGKDVVEEDLRQLCVWEQAKSSLRSDGARAWWNYVIEFAASCHPGRIPTADKFTEQCSRSVHEKLGISWQATTQCVAKSWQGTKNTILEAELTARQDRSILQLPTVMVNNAILRGGVNANSVLGAICQGFQEGTAPKVCECVERTAATGSVANCVVSTCTKSGEQFCGLDSKCYSLEDYRVKCSPSCAPGQYFCQSTQMCYLPESANACMKCPDPKKPFYCAAKGACSVSLENCSPASVSVAGVIAIVFSVSLLILAGAMVYWRRQKKKMQEDVRNILAEYMPLEELESRNGGGIVRPSGAVPPMSSNASPGTEMVGSKSNALNMI